MILRLVCSSRVTRILLSACFVLACATSQSAAQQREWVDRTGKFRVQAELVTVRDGKAYLERPGGKLSKVPLQRLSEGDLLFLANQTKYKSAVAPFLQPGHQTSAAQSSKRSGTIKMAKIQADAPDRTKSIRQFHSDRWGYKGLAFSADGAFLFTTTSGKLVVFNVNTRAATQYDLHSARPSVLACSDDGSRLVVGIDQGQVMVWNHDGKGNLKLADQFPVQRGEIRGIGISPDNRHAISLHQSRGACYWEIDTGKRLAIFEDINFHFGGDVEFSKRGTQAIIADGSVGVVVDLSELKVLQQMPLSVGNGRFAKIAPGGDQLATGRTYDVHFVNTKRNSGLLVGQGKESKWSAAYSPDGRWLVTGGSGNVKLWDAQTAALVSEFKTSQRGHVGFVEFSPDGVHLAAIGGAIGKDIEVFRIPDQLANR